VSVLSPAKLGRRKARVLARKAVKVRPHPGPRARSWTSLSAQVVRGLVRDERAEEKCL
jgi:hypothetical protein